MLSVNNTNYSPNFGCKKQATETFAKIGKENFAEMFQRIKNQPKLKLDKWGRVISTNEECEEFLKFADKNILSQARENLEKHHAQAEKLYNDYISNPTAYHFRTFHPTRFITSRPHLSSANYALELCREYQRIIEAGRHDARLESVLLGKTDTNLSHKFDSISYHLQGIQKANKHI